MNDIYIYLNQILFTWFSFVIVSPFLLHSGKNVGFLQVEPVLVQSENRFFENV